jgi:hypothetical protein
MAEVREGNLVVPRCPMCKLPEKFGGRHLAPAHCVRALVAANGLLARQVAASSAARVRFERFAKALWLLLRGRAVLDKEGLIVAIDELRALDSNAGFEFDNLVSADSKEPKLMRIRPTLRTEELVQQLEGGRISFRAVYEGRTFEIQGSPVVKDGVFERLEIDKVVDAATGGELGILTLGPEFGPVMSDAYRQAVEEIARVEREKREATS